MVLLREYLNHFHETVIPTADIYIDSDENAPLYTQYNTFRRVQANGKEKQKKSQLSSSLFKLETEQLVFTRLYVIWLMEDGLWLYLFIFVFK